MTTRKNQVRLRIQHIIGSTVDTCTSVPVVVESCLCAEVIVFTRQEIRPWTNSCRVSLGLQFHLQLEGPCVPGSWRARLFHIPPASSSHLFGVCETVGTLLAERLVRHWIQFRRQFRRPESRHGEVCIFDASAALWFHGELGS